jgi:chromosomal replication initiation ATPase DnaA
MTEAPEQLVLDLPHRQALGAEDFLVSTSNQVAVDMVDRWPDWPHRVLVVTGPEGCGKTHLANVWRHRSGAHLIQASDLRDADIGTRDLTAGIVVEDGDRGVADEQALFHLLNLAREQRFTVLLTGRGQPGDWILRIPDLRSRLRAAAVVVIEPPDTALLHAVLVKLFSDRQLVVEPRVVSHLVTRMERSMAAAIRLVAEIDRRALQMHRKVTRALAADVLEAWTEKVGGKRPTPDVT